MLQSILISICLLAFGPNPTEYPALYTLKEHKLYVKGSSSLHDWDIHVSKAQAQSKITMEQGKLKSIESLHLEIPVQGLLSTKKSSTMDSKAHEALKKSNYPIIDFKLEEVVSISNIPTGQQVTARGILTIAGAQKSETLTVTAMVLPSGLISFKGQKKLWMTDFNISPPKAMFNTLSTGNEVLIDFEITLSKNQ